VQGHRGERLVQDCIKEKTHCKEWGMCTDRKCQERRYGFLSITQKHQKEDLLRWKCLAESHTHKIHECKVHS
jgi:hypothetical protein